MGQNQEYDHWVIWYPSYTLKDLRLIKERLPIVEDLTDSYFSLEHTYLKIETYLSEDANNPNRKENIQLSFYKIVRENPAFFKFEHWLFRKGLLKDRPQQRPIDNIIPQLNEDNCIAIIKLLYKSHSENGLFVYECRADDNPKNFLSGVQSFSENNDQYPTFYCIKQLYHTHLFHNKSRNNNNNNYKDYYFRAFFVKGEPNVTNVNNKSIVFYLGKIFEHFEMQLKHFEEIKTGMSADNYALKKRISDDIQVLKEKIYDLKENDPKSLFLKDLWEKEIKKRRKSKEYLINIPNEAYKSRLLFRTSNDIIGETLFTNILCNSKNLDKRNNEVRRLLLNIENIKIGLCYIRDNYKYFYEKQDAKHSFFLSRMSVSLGWLGYIVGTIGIIFSFYTHKTEKTSQKMDETIRILYQTQDSLINNKINMIQKMDSIFIESLKELNTKSPIED